MIPPPTTATVGAFILTERVFSILNNLYGSSLILRIVCPVTSYWFDWIIPAKKSGILLFTLP